MKVIDLSAKKNMGKRPGLLGRAGGALNSLSTKKESQAQGTVTNALMKVLDNRFYLLCNILLAGLEVPIPQVLVGPTGIWVIYAVPTKGIFRADESRWEAFNERTSGFEPGKPNYIARAILLAKAVESFFTSKEMALPAIEPILFFANPGVHVDSTRPAARIVLADGLERFLANVIQLPLVLETENIHKIVDELAGTSEGRELDQTAETEDAFSYKELPPEKSAHPSPIVEKLSNVGRGEPEFAKQVTDKNPFNRRQWVVLGSLVLAIFVLLIVLIFVFLIFSPIG